MHDLPDDFLKRYIRKAVRDRVAHEWKKKAGKLHYRICHKADELFISGQQGKSVEFDANEDVLVLGFGVHGKMRYREAERHLGIGGGTLIVRCVS